MARVAPALMLIALLVALPFNGPSANAEVEPIVVTLDAPDWSGSFFAVPFTGTVTLGGKPLPWVPVMLEYHYENQEDYRAHRHGPVTTDGEGRFAFLLTLAHAPGVWTFRATVSTREPTYNLPATPNVVHSDPHHLQVQDVQAQADAVDGFNVTAHSIVAYRYRGDVIAYVNVAGRVDPTLLPERHVNTQAKIVTSVPCWVGTSGCWQAVHEQIVSGRHHAGLQGQVHGVVGPFTWLNDYGNDRCYPSLQVQLAGWYRSGDEIQGEVDWHEQEVCPY